MDGLPVVPEDSKPKLVKFLLRKLNSVGRTSEDAVYMPVNDKKMSEGYAQRCLSYQSMATSTEFYLDTPSSSTPLPSKLLPL